MAATQRRPRVTSPAITRDPPSSSETTPGAEPSAKPYAYLLRLESDARHCRSLREIYALLANESRKLLRARQAFVFECRDGKCKLVAISNLASLDRSTPLAQWIETTVINLGKDAGLAQTAEFELPAYARDDDPFTRDYPFRHFLWQPMWSPDGKIHAGSVYVRETIWLDADRKIAARLGETFGHSRALLSTAGVFRKTRNRSRVRYWLAALAVAILAGLVPVHMSVLAPVEVVPRNADVVAMPIEGIVQKLLVRPNEAVEAGTPLVQLVDTVQRNRAEVAEREVAVVAARVEKATSLAFSDPRGRQELGIARAELALKLAELKFARDILAQTVIAATQSGIAVFSDPKELEGKPLGIGERLMLLAREGDTELKISLSVADSIVLTPGLPVKAFLDADPLNAATGEISNVDFQVRVDEAQIATYRVTARLNSNAPRLKLGSRGTAQILGERAPLFFYVFRRPLTSLRQWSGL